MLYLLPHAEENDPSTGQESPGEVVLWSGLRSGLSQTPLQFEEISELDRNFTDVSGVLILRFWQEEVRPIIFEVMLRSHVHPEGCSQFGDFHCHRLTVSDPYSTETIQLWSQRQA